jgi:hypothetical protein
MTLPTPIPISHLHTYTRIHSNNNTYSLYLLPFFFSTCRDAEEALCSWAEAGLTLRFVLFIAIIVSFITSLLMHPVDMLFDLLSAPLADSTKLANRSDKVTEANTRPFSQSGQPGGHTQSRAPARRMAVTAAIAKQASNFARRMSITATKVNTGIANTFRVNRLILGFSTRAIPAATESAFALAQQSGKLLQVHAENRRLTRLQVSIFCREKNENI